MLGELEQVVLLAVLRVGKNAYGVPVHDEIQTRAGRDLTLGTIYKTLSRLEEKGLVASHVGDPTPERGGRRTRCGPHTQSHGEDQRGALLPKPRKPGLAMGQARNWMRRHSHGMIVSA